MELVCNPATSLTSHPSAGLIDSISSSVELAVGVIAASFPTIKPLVKSIIGSARGQSSRSYGQSRKHTGEAYGPNSHALSALSRNLHDQEEDKYRVQIHANHPSLSASDDGSEENLARDRRQTPLNLGIVQTTEVIVHTEDSADLNMGSAMMGPRRTVEDRI